MGEPWSETCSFFFQISSSGIWVLGLGVEKKTGSRLFREYNDVCVRPKNVLNALVLKKRSESFRLDKFFILLHSALS